MHLQPCFCLRPADVVKFKQIGGLMKMEKSRYARGRAISRQFAGREMAVRGPSWANPFKGGHRKTATAQVAMKGLGLFVGFRINL